MQTQKDHPSYSNAKSQSHSAGSDEGIGADLNALRSDLFALKDTVAEMVAKAGNDAVKVAKEKTADVADQVGTAASDLASAASERAKTFAGELERVGRANPLGALAGALLVGVVIGMIGRRR